MNKLLLLSLLVFLGCNSDDKIQSLQMKTDSLEKKTERLEKENQDLKNYDPLYENKHGEDVEIPIAIRYYFQSLETKNYELLIGCFAPNFYRYYDNYNPFDMDKFQNEQTQIWENVDQIAINISHIEKTGDYQYNVVTKINYYIYSEYPNKRTDTFIENIEFILDDITRIKAIYKIN
jgi:hypothetical protein